MDIKALRQRAADLQAQVKAILDKVDPAAGLSDEQRNQINELKAQQEKNNELIKIVEEQMTADLNLQGVQTVELIKENIEDDPSGGFKNHLDFCTAVMEAGSGRGEDKRLQRYRAAQGSDEQQAGQDPYGGYLVPVGVAPGLLTVDPEDDPAGKLVRQVPMTAPTVAFNARVDKDHTSSVSGGLTVTRKPETADASASRKKFEQIRLTATDLFGLTYATENILTDSPISFVSLLNAGFSDEFSAKLMEERLNGTGAGEFLGVMKSNALVTVAKQSSQTADTIVKENIDNMIARCWKYGRAVWHANHTTIPQLMGLYQLVGTTGGAPVAYLTGNPGGPQMLCNRPIYFTERAAALGDKGDIVLVDWKEYLQATYQSMRRDESVHVRFLANERCFRFYLRNDGKPWWTSALTPKRGNTLSPFVTLAARA